jgi:hypothetical protein
VTIDIVIDSVPPFDSINFAGGISGFALNLLYNPAVVNVTAKAPLSGSSIIAGPPSFTSASQTEGAPEATPDGNYKIFEGDNSVNFESGAGVLIRLTLTAVGAGTSNLTLDDTTSGSTAFGDNGDHIPGIYDANADKYPLGNVIGGQVVVDGACPASASGPGPVVAAAQQAPRLVADAIAPLASEASAGMPVLVILLGGLTLAIGAAGLIVVRRMR